MSTETVLTPDAVVEAGKRLYDENICAQVAAGNTGKLLMIDVTTGDWVMGSDRLEMGQCLCERNPHAQNYALRIGYPAAEKFGAWPHGTREEPLTTLAV